MPALALHCGLAHAGTWRGVAHALRDQLALTGFDMPGHGESPPWDGVTDPHDLVTAQARALLTAPAHLIGHSFGATVALRVALEVPDMVRSLTLIEPVFFAAAAEAEPEALAEYRTAARPFAEATARRDWDTAARVFALSWGTPWDALPPHQQAGFAALMPMIAATEPSLNDDTAGLLRRGRLEALSMPVTLLHGSASPPIIPAILRALAARIPSARLTVVPGAGHMVPITHPVQVAQAIGRMLRDPVA